MLDPISATDPEFDMAAAYEVLAHIAQRRREQGWSAVGRKIGFTNQTIWPLYGVHEPMWAYVWDRTVVHAVDDVIVSLDAFVQPRIEPEVVFYLGAEVPATDDPFAVVEAALAIAPAFEVVQCPYPEWKFTLPDCTAAFGLHAALIVGPSMPIDADDRHAVVELLATFQATLRRDGGEVDQGTGANVLGSPARALAHLARVLAAQPQFEPLAAGELITTGTLTNAWPVAPGERWTADYGALGLAALAVTFS